jgi:UDP-3-O-[3-hydroxymyristoyl] N-acetylglucosamine deacetylase
MGSEKAGAPQHTLSTRVTAEGVSLHAGGRTHISLAPAPADAGILFRRTDAVGRFADIDIPARADRVTDARLGVRIQNAAGVSAMTVEHLLAAFALADIDNAVVEIDAEEVPIFDGSLAPYLDLIAQAGRTPLGAPRRRLFVDRPIRVEAGDRFVEIAPAQNRTLEVAIDYAEAAIGRQSIAVDLQDAAARRRIAQARTFCSLKDVEAMRASGRAHGGSLDNAIVVDGARILNDGPLRDPLEFVLHKAADLLGDLSLVGAPVLGAVRAFRPGHDLNTRLARQILAAARPVA